MSAPHERTTGPQSVGRALPYRRLVVALDGSERAERILPQVAMLARQFGATVTLVRVITPPGPPVPEVPEGATRGHRAVPAPTPCADRERGETARYLWALADSLGAEGLRVDWLAAEGQAAEAIVQRAREVGADLIAMTTHGRSELARHVLGSVADEVMRRADCPVLVLRTPEAHDQRPEPRDRGAPPRP
jgi:nucleotide-binding universal stress UspA family protein